MKTEIKITIESPDTLSVYDEDKFIESYTKGEDVKTKAYDEEYDKEFAKGVHQNIVNEVKKVKERITDKFDEGVLLEDYLIEDWGDLEKDYKINISIENEN